MEREYIETVVKLHIPSRFSHLYEVVSDGIEESSKQCPKWVTLTKDEVMDALQDVLENGI